MHILHGEIAVLVLLKLFNNTMIVKDAYLTWGNSSLGFVEAVHQYNGSERCHRIGPLPKSGTLCSNPNNIQSLIPTDKYNTKASESYVIDYLGIVLLYRCKYTGFGDK